MRRGPIFDRLPGQDGSPLISWQWVTTTAVRQGPIFDRLVRIGLIFFLDEVST